MIFQRQLPSLPLRGLVEYFWYHEGVVSAHTMERLLPDGAIELIVDLTDTPKIWAANDRPERSCTVRRSWVSGQQSRPILIEAAKQSCMVGARFFPGGITAIMPGPVSALNDAVIEMDLIWGGLAGALRDRLLAATTIKARFQVFENVLIGMRTNRGRGATVQHALKRIRCAPEFMTIRTLANELGLSQTSMTRLFKEEVGLTPKRLARILRFQRILRELSRGARPRLAALAAAHGYYDQSHFIREFNLLSGMHPTEYLDSNWEYFNFVPVR